MSGYPDAGSMPVRAMSTFSLRGVKVRMAGISGEAVGIVATLMRCMVVATGHRIVRPAIAGKANAERSCRARCFQ